MAANNRRCNFFLVPNLRRNQLKIKALPDLAEVYWLSASNHAALCTHYYISYNAALINFIYISMPLFFAWWSLCAISSAVPSFGIPTFERKQRNVIW
jgi:hypothetical protein